ncbi:MAG TPA: response regulator transcription factor [Anaerolineae bacterium]
MTENKLRILAVDDEPAIRRFLQLTLAAEGYGVIEVGSGREALAQFAGYRPDLVILDLGLPDIDGVEVTRILRAQSQVPIIILSVRDQEHDKVAALDAGADDYLTKPFGTAEFLARIRGVLRRANQNPVGPVFAADGLEVDLTRRLVTVAGREVHLSPTEYDLLRTLVMQAGRVLTHRQLLREVWGPAYEGENHLLRVTVGHLRQKVEPEPGRPHWILTEPGVGYRLHTAA